MRKRIVLDATPFIFNFGGVGRVTQTLFNAMAELESDFEFQLYARCFKGRSPPLPSGAEALKHLRLPKSAEPFMAKVGLIEALARGDLYHATDHYLPLKHPEKAVVTIHDLLFMTRPEAGWGIHGHQLKVVPPFAKRCRCIITCSNYTRKDIVEQLQVDPETIHVIPWGIDQTEFQPAADPEDLRETLRRQLGIDFPYFLSVGCNAGRKNTPRLLEAYAAMVGDSPTHHLVLVWNPPDEIREKYAKPPFDQFIHFTGKVSDERLVQLYQGAAVTAYPSDYEGFGLPVLESFACGVPVITSDRSSLPEVGGDAALYINPDDCDSIRAALCRFENGEVDLAELREKGLAVCRKFTWEACAAQTLKVYELALEELS